MTEQGWGEVDSPVTLPNGVQIYPSDVRELVLDRKTGRDRTRGDYATAVVRLVDKRGKGQAIDVPPGEDPDAFLQRLYRILTRAN